MEPEILDPIPIWYQLWGFFLVAVVPYVFYSLGVCTDIVLGLHPEFTRREIVMMSIPVGLVSVGALIGANSVADPRNPSLPLLYTYYDSVSKFMVFQGTVMFIGLNAPHLFGFYLKNGLGRGRFRLGSQSGRATREESEEGNSQ